MSVECSSSCVAADDVREGAVPGHDLLGSMIDCLCRAGASPDERSAVHRRLGSLPVLEVVEALTGSGKKEER